MGMSTRIVSNGSWAKRLVRAKEICNELKRAGLDELNISTGNDHQEFVPQESVVNAAESAIACDITTLITVETDTEDSDCYTSIRSDERVKELLKNRRFHLASNFWMPFHADALERRQPANVDGLRKGRSEERRVGKEGVSTWRSRWAPEHK